MTALSAALCFSNKKYTDLAAESPEHQQQGAASPGGAQPWAAGSAWKLLTGCGICVHFTCLCNSAAVTPTHEAPSFF